MFIYCDIYKKAFKSNNLSAFTRHEETRDHQCKNAPHNIDSFMCPSEEKKFSKKELTKIVGIPFLRADIPLYKLRNDDIKGMLNKLCGENISDTYVRGQMNEWVVEYKSKVKEFVKDKRFYLVVDESPIKKQKFGCFCLV